MTKKTLKDLKKFEEMMYNDTKSSFDEFAKKLNFIKFQAYLNRKENKIIKTKIKLFGKISHSVISLNEYKQNFKKEILDNPKKLEANIHGNLLDLNTFYNSINNSGNVSRTLMDIKEDIIKSINKPRFEKILRKQFVSFNNNPVLKALAETLIKLKNPVRKLIILEEAKLEYFRNKKIGINEAYNQNNKEYNFAIQETMNELIEKKNYLKEELEAIEYVLSLLNKFYKDTQEYLGDLIKHYPGIPKHVKLGLKKRKPVWKWVRYGLAASFAILIGSVYIFRYEILSELLVLTLQKGDLNSIWKIAQDIGIHSKDQIIKFCNQIGHYNNIGDLLKIVEGNVVQGADGIFGDIVNKPLKIPVETLKENLKNIPDIIEFIKKNYVSMINF